jgi:16S rRNA (guanine527-N7)-methyltransferase
MQEKLDAYLELLLAYAPRLNLVSRSDLPHLQERHVEDSLRLLPLLDSLPAGPCIDVGSGAGLPGVPLACARSDRLWILLEPRAKRAAFLEEVVRQLELNVQVLCERAEDASRGGHQGRFVLATARALADPERASELIRPFLRSDGVGAVYLGEHSPIPEAAEESSEGIAIVRPMPTAPQDT